MNTSAKKPRAKQAKKKLSDTPIKRDELRLMSGNITAELAQRGAGWAHAPLAIRKGKASAKGKDKPGQPNSQPAHITPPPAVLAFDVGAHTAAALVVGSIDSGMSSLVYEFKPTKGIQRAWCLALSQTFQKVRSLAHDLRLACASRNNSPEPTEEEPILVVIEGAYAHLNVSTYGQLMAMAGAIGAYATLSGLPFVIVQPAWRNAVLGPSKRTEGKITMIKLAEHITRFMDSNSTPSHTEHTADALMLAYYAQGYAGLPTLLHNTTP